MRVEVIKSKRSTPVDIGAVKGIAKKALAMEKAPGGSAVCIRFVTDAVIKKLNKTYLKNDSATDVMAFSMLEGRRIAGQSGYIGDVAISLAAARRQSKIFGTTFKNEVRLYVVHGILHLLGYDDISLKNRLKMRKRESEILSKSRAV